MRTIITSAVVALVVAIAVSVFAPIRTERVIEKVVKDQLGAFPGGDILVPVEFKDGLFSTASGTIGIGTTTRHFAQKNQGFNLILDGQNATPTIAFFATSTVGATDSYNSQNAPSGCIQFGSGTTTGDYYRLYVGESSNVTDVNSLDGRGLIFEKGACQ